MESVRGLAPKPYGRTRPEARHRISRHHSGRQSRTNVDGVDVGTRHAERSPKLRVIDGMATLPGDACGGKRIAFAFTRPRRSYQVGGNCDARAGYDTNPIQNKPTITTIFPIRSAIAGFHDILRECGISLHKHLSFTTFTLFASAVRRLA
jgi:hypothetical protein